MFAIQCSRRFLVQRFVRNVLSRNNISDHQVKQSEKHYEEKLMDHSNYDSRKNCSNCHQENVSLTRIEQTGMTADDWNRRWENKTKVRRWELLTVHPFLEKYPPSSSIHHRVLVPLAGKTPDLFWLVEKGFQVIGVECSSLACQEFLNEHLGVNNYKFEQRSSTCSIYSAYNDRLVLIACDIFADELNPSLIGGPVSFVWDRAALTALHPVDHGRYIEKLKQLAENDAQILISVYWHSGPVDRDPPYPISKEIINKLFPRSEIVQLDELDSMNESWAQAGYTDLCERCYRIQL